MQAKKAKNGLERPISPESGLHYNLARSYNPIMSRWPSPDSATTRIYDPQSLNKYAYNRNDPVNYVDPEGKDPVYVSPETISGGTVWGTPYEEPVNFYYMYYMVSWGFFMNEYILWSQGYYYQPANYGGSGSEGGGGGSGPGDQATHTQADLQKLLDSPDLKKDLGNRAQRGDCNKFLTGLIIESRII
jgi:RHS repeat-associated protein